MTKREELIKHFYLQKFLSASAIREFGIPSQFVTDLVRRGEIVRVAKGLYSIADITASETEDFELVSYIVPKGVICLISALRFHKLTDENPYEISIAIPKGYHAPTATYPPMRFFAFSELAYSTEIKIVQCNGIDVKIYSIEKTISDCFKFRNKIGIDVAVSALRDAIKQNRIDYNVLWNTAKICRVSKVIRPYLEAIQ